MRHRLLGLAGLLTVWALSASSAHAQAPATFLVLDPVGVSDPSIAAQISVSLRTVAEPLGYHVVTPGAGSVLGSLDGTAATDLVSIVSRSSIDRGVAVWVAATSTGYDVQVGIASHDGTAMSVHVVTDPSSLVTLPSRLLAAILPPAGAPITGAWGGTAQLQAGPAPAPPPVAATATTSAPQPYLVPDDAPPVAPPRRGHQREAGYLIGGAVSFGVGWIFNILFGLFAGYHTCVLGTCSSSFDPAWDGFRAASVLPIAGPWVQLAVRPNADADLWDEWLILDGILQGVGAIFMFVGIGIFASGEDEPAEPAVTLMPLLSPSTAGLSLAGRF